jgi:hypothetical protein
VKSIIEQGFVGQSPRPAAFFSWRRKLKESVVQGVNRIFLCVLHSEPELILHPPPTDSKTLAIHENGRRDNDNDGAIRLVDADDFWRMQRQFVLKGQFRDFAFDSSGHAVLSVAN